jgi:hypothetical protein
VEVQVLSSACARSSRALFLSAVQAYARPVAVEPTQAPPNEPYPGPALLAAGMTTLFFPVISLIAALLLLSAEQLPSRRASLRMWAWASVAWIALQVLVVILFVAAWSSGGAGGGGEIGPVVP